MLFDLERRVEDGTQAENIGSTSIELLSAMAET